MKFKLGLKPPREDPRTLKFIDYVDVGGLPFPANPAIDWFAARLRLGPMPMWGNDQYSDCFWAMMANLLQIDSANSGNMTEITESDVLAAYSGCTGFDPKAPLIQDPEGGPDPINP